MTSYSSVFALQERMNVLDNLKKKAEIVSKAFNAFDGITCNKIQGAMYCFPKLDLPPRAIKHAEVQQPLVYHLLVTVVR